MGTLVKRGSEGGGAVVWLETKLEAPSPGLAHGDLLPEDWNQLDALDRAACFDV